jgi:hypothetical protein
MSELKGDFQKKTFTPLPKSSFLITGIDTVEQFVNNPFLKYIEGKIYTGSANADEVLAWYRSRDPLYETKINKILSEERKANHVLEQTIVGEIKYAYLCEQGSLILAREALRHISSDEAYDIKTQRLQKEALDKLFISAEMSYEAFRKIKIGVESLYPIDLQKTYGLHPEFNNFSDRMEHDLGYASDALETIQGIAFNPNKPRDPEILMLGIRAGWELINTRVLRTKEPSPEKEKKKREKYLMQVTNMYRNVFLGKNGLLNNNAISSTIKGELYELMWILDANIFLLMRDDLETYVTFASHHEDMPWVGKPKLRRGFDITINNTKTDALYYIQLKSSPTQAEKSYHPAITLVHETNFQDINPGRLHLKLLAYKKLIDSGFSEDDIQHVLRNKYILPSVIKALDTTKKDTLKTLLQT